MLEECSKHGTPLKNLLRKSIHSLKRCSQSEITFNIAKICSIRKIRSYIDNQLIIKGEKKLNI